MMPRRGKSASNLSATGSINPNINFPDKKKRNEPQSHYRSAGAVSTSNIRWTYDLRPIKKWTIILLSLGAIIAFTFYMQKENEKAEQEKTIGIEAQDVKRRYLEKRLEIIKQETIAAENSNISSEARKSNVNEPAKQVQQRGPKIYSWINEKGQKVYSNRPQEP